jgi:hypothetical protein
MLMLDVRNAISTVLDRFTLADIVEITLRKYRRDKVTPPFLHRPIPLTSVVVRTNQAGNSANGRTIQGIFKRQGKSVKQ